MIIKQGMVLEIKGRLATVTYIEILPSEVYEFEAIVGFIWSDNGRGDNALGSRLLRAIKDGEVVVIQD